MPRARDLKDRRAQWAKSLHYAKVALSDIERWVKSGTSPEDERRELAARSRRIDSAKRAAATRRIRAALKEREIEELRQKAAQSPERFWRDDQGT
jgi:hypothetical protein